MLEWINSHGLTIIIGYGLFAAFVGSMPPLPHTASYWQRWAYGFLHMAAMNLREAGRLLKIPGTNGGNYQPPTSIPPDKPPV